MSAKKCPQLLEIEKTVESYVRDLQLLCNLFRRPLLLKDLSKEDDRLIFSNCEKIREVHEALLLGALLAPTDAALGQAVVSMPAVPQRIRYALNVESGLNDGIALPVILVLMAVAVALPAVSFFAMHARMLDRQEVLSNNYAVRDGPVRYHFALTGDIPKSKRG